MYLKDVFIKIIDLLQDFNFFLHIVKLSLWTTIGHRYPHYTIYLVCLKNYP